LMDYPCVWICWRYWCVRLDAISQVDIVPCHNSLHPGFIGQSSLSITDSGALTEGAVQSHCLGPRSPLTGRRKIGILLGRR
jgi:hypothetical protein